MTPLPTPPGPRIAAVLAAMLAYGLLFLPLYRSVGAEAVAAGMALLLGVGSLRALRERDRRRVQALDELAERLRRSREELERQMEERTAELRAGYEALRESEERYRAVVETLGEGLLVTDLEDRILYANPRVREIFGYEPGELVGRVGYEVLIPPDAREAFLRQLEVRQGGGAGRYEIRHARRDGSRGWIEVCASPLRDASGTVVGTLGAITDVTERRRTTGALNLAREQHEALLNSIPDVAFLKDENSRFLAVNEACARSCGAPREEVVGKTDLDFFPPAIAVKYRADDRRVLAEGRRIVVEEVLQEPDGTLRWVETVKTPFRDEAGECVGIAGIARDITERRLSEKALRESEAGFRAVFNAAAIGVTLVDVEGRLLDTNPALRTLLGYGGEELRGRSIAYFTHPDDLQASQEAIARVRDGEVDYYQMEKRYLRSDGKEIWGHLTVSLIRDPEGRPRSMLGLIEDVTERRRTEEALRESEMRFRQLAENIREVFYINDGGTSRVLYVSPAYEEIWGRSREDLYRDPGSWRDALHPDDRSGTAERLRRSTGEGYDIEYRIVRPDGEVRWIRDRAFPVRDEDGRVYRDAGIAEDITDRKRAEEALRASEDRYRALFDGGNDAVLVYEIGSDGMPSCFREVNSIACQRLGYSREELLGMSLVDLHPANRRGRIEEILERLKGERKILLESLHVARDGTRIPVEINARLVEIEGRPTVVSTARDVTERKRAEEALRESEKYFRSLIENMWDVIHVVNGDGTIRFAGPSVERVLGYAPEELAGTSLFAYMHPDDADGARKSFRQVLGRPGPDPKRVEFRIRHRDGSWRVHEGLGNNLLHDPVVRGFIINSRDVTERKTAEEALNESRQQLLQAQKMDAVGRLAGGIAHDFNNMLTAIQGFAQLLGMELGEREPERGYVEEIRRAAERSGSLTRQLLAFSRRQVLQPRTLDLNETVREMDRMLRRLIGADVELVTVLAPGLEPVLADHGQLEQVVLNLAVNAREAMPAGGALTIETSDVEVGEAEVRRLSFLRPGRYVQLRVGDTGAGMSPDVQAQVFEPFFTTKENGTGLGLATVYGIVAQSGGHVWVESAPGEGSTFRILLPRVVAGPEPGPREAAAGGAAAGAETVLLVEDEPTVRLLARKVLQRSGYRVVEAENGAEGIRLFEEHAEEIDLVLTDVVMPRMGGVEMVGRLAALAPSLRVVYMSGYTDEAILRSGVQEQGKTFLQKPFSPETLVRKVREVLDGG